VKVMCFAMREGIVDQRSDVCGDVETNVNERRTTTASLPTLFRSSMFPLLRETNLRLLLSPLPTPPRLASSLLSLFCPLGIRILLFFFDAPWLLRSCLYTQILYAVFYVPANGARARIWCIYYSYVLCKMPKRAYKHVYTRYWVWQPQRIIILVLR